MTSRDERPLTVRLKTKKKRTVSQKRWLERQLNDPYVARAKREGLRSRAAFKLIEIDDKYHLLKGGGRVLDLGAAPGGWSQVAAQAVAPGGHVFALDLLEMPPLPGVDHVRGDFSSAETVAELERRLAGRPVDLVLSDMAPNMSGIAVVDQARMMALAEFARDFALKHLKPQGKFLVKLFQGAGFEPFLRTMRACFMQVLVRKPEASRGRSKEVYLLGKGMKNG